MIQEFSSNIVPLLKMEKIVKTFPGTLAVNKVDLVCKSGEIHGLVGENGAGKSTLMKVLAGRYQPDSGNIFINGEERKFSSCSEARESKIGIIYQELSLFPHLSVAENIYMGIWPKKKHFINWQEIKSKSKIILNQIGVDINPDLLVSSLPMALRQMVEIAKILTQNPEIIIFDEPTSALSRDEVLKLFNILIQLRTKGKGIIFISHRLNEILEISDTITVMKDGQEVITKNASYFDEDKLISYMIGREFSKIFPAKRLQKEKEKIFYFEGILGKSNKKIIFSVFKGEILGVGGLQGQGQIDLLQSIFGLGGCKDRKIKIFGKDVEIKNPFRAVKKGIVLIPENRNEEGIFLILSVLENLTASTIDNRHTFGLIQRQLENKVVKDIVKRLSIKITSLDQAAQSLSGGNLQKLVLGKWLISKPKIIIMLEPTKGVDVGTKQQIYILIREIVKNNVAIILYTSEMLELIGLCDRVLVMNHGFLTANLKGKEITEERIVKASVSDINVLGEK